MSNLRSSSAHGGKPATLDDVAALAEVSPKTVSRVVNSEAGVHSATRERVRRAIELLDYKPNLNARVLAGDRSYTIGLFCERPGDYLSAFQASATDRCRESGYHLIVEEWNRANPNAVRHVTALLHQLRPDGAILLPPLSDDRLIYNTLLDASIPNNQCQVLQKSHAGDCKRRQPQRVTKLESSVTQNPKWKMKALSHLALILSGLRT